MSILLSLPLSVSPSATLSHLLRRDDLLLRTESPSIIIIVHTSHHCHYGRFFEAIHLERRGVVRVLVGLLHCFSLKYESLVYTHRHTSVHTNTHLFLCKHSLDFLSYLLL